MMVKTAHSFFRDIRTGIGLGRYSLALLALSALLWFELQNYLGNSSASIFANMTSADAMGSAEAMPDISGLAWLTTTTNILCFGLMFLGYCWLLRNWLVVEFGQGTGLTGKKFLGHIAINQAFAWFLGCLISTLISIVTMLVTFFVLVEPYMSKVFSPGDTILSAMLGLFPVFLILLGLNFLMCFVAVYFAFRYSAALGVTAQSGATYNLFRAYKHSGLAAPRGSALRAAATLSGMILMLSIIMLLVTAALGWSLGLPAYTVIFNGEPLSTDILGADSNKIALQLAFGSLALISFIAMPFLACLSLIRYLRKIPTDIEASSSAG